MLLGDPITRLPDISAFVPEKAGACVDIWWWPYENEVNWNSIRSELTTSEQERASAFHFKKDAIAFMAGRYLQRSILSQYTSVPAKDLTIAIGPQGKPYIANTRIAFNLTRTEGLVVFAISRDCMTLGIDAESIETAIEPDTSLLFCSTAESEILEALQGKERQLLLISYWTLKESLLKAVGSGLMAAPNELNIWLDRTANAIRIDQRSARDSAFWHHCLLQAPSGHSIAISIQSDQAKLTLRQQKLPDPE